jgi:hypothetical protein
MIKKLIIVLILVGIALLPAEVFAEKTAVEMINSSFDLFRGGVNTESEEIVVVVFYGKGNRKKESTLNRYTQFDSEGYDKVSIAFKKPKWDKLQIFCSENRIERISIQLRKKGGARRYSKSREGGYFAGTDLQIKDCYQMLKERTADYSYGFIENSDPEISKKFPNHWVIEANPQIGKEASVSYIYKKRLFWIEKNTGVISYIQYWNSRRIEKEQFNKEIAFYGPDKKIWRVNVLEIKNHRQGRTSLFSVKKREINGKILSGIFDERFFVK